MRIIELTMPDMLPSVLSTESDASGNTCSLKYASVTPHTWIYVSAPGASGREAEQRECPLLTSLPPRKGYHGRR